MSSLVQEEVNSAEDLPAASTTNRPPPKLEKEIRIPVLQIERLPSPAMIEGSPDNNGDSFEDLAVGTSPPQLDKCIEDDDISTSSRSSTRDYKSCKRNFITASKKKKGKIAKSRRLLRPKQQYLRIKIAPAGFGRRKQAEEEDGDEESENGDDADDDCPQSSHGQIYSDIKRELRSRAGGNQSEEEGECDKDQHDVKKPENNDDQDSRKSEDEEDGYRDSDDREHEWKPVRAAMVAAMELVAKKQVTDDMRMERRIRKQVFKPLPPKGRGRRAIFKRLNKPMKSCDHTIGASVTDLVYYDNTFFLKGDIICLIQDLCGPFYPDLERHRFFQINGFLKVPHMDGCASLTLLKRVIPMPEPIPIREPEDVIFGVIDTSNKEEETEECIEEEEKSIEEEEEKNDEEEPYRFKLLDYRPVNSAEIMVVLSQLKFVMRCPPDFYYGHDVLFSSKPKSDRIYTRLGVDIYDYDEEELSDLKLNTATTDTSNNENDCSESNNSNCNNVKCDDKESVVSSSNSTQSSNSRSNSNNFNDDSNINSCNIDTMIVDLPQ